MEDNKNIVEQTATIPDVLYINGVAHTVKDNIEIQNFIKSVAKVEKSKLYSQIEQLREQTKKLENVQILPDPTKAVAPSFDAAEMEKNIAKLVDVALEEKLKAIETKKTQEQSLNEYRDSIVKENQDKCIPELVKGTTKEELDSSMADSIRLRQSYPSPNTMPTPTGATIDPLLAKQFGEQQMIPMEAALPKIPNIPAADPSNQGKSVKAMSMEEFAKQRDNLIDGMQSLYGGQ